jgi:hypothetical protein
MKRSILLLAVVMAGLALAQRDTLLRQDFDSTWTPDNPPSGWDISYTGSPGVDAWHRENANAYPWLSNNTPYAQIKPSSQADHVDTLYSPSIDCSRYRNIDLLCQTYFRPYSPQSYVASVIVSTDGGYNWRPVREYFNDSVGPILERVDIDSVGLHPDVRLAWVWSGNLSNIYWWCLDDVKIVGTQVHDTDAMTTRKNSPRRHEMPGTSFSPTAVFRNRGRQGMDSVPVCAELWFGATLLYQNWDKILNMQPSHVDTVQFPSYTPTDTGVFTVVFYTALAGDQYRANDTVRRDFTISYGDYVYFDNDTNAGLAHWLLGATSGWGLKVAPLTNRAKIVFSQFKLHVPGVYADRYRILIMDDDGPAGAPGTTIFQSPTRHANEGWNTDTLAPRDLIVNGSFYLFYIQSGDWPFCPELYHDSGRTEEAEYWSLNAGNYYQDTDTTNGDWMIRCMLDYNVSGGADTNARVVYVSQPDDELTPRPAGIRFVPAARIENHGLAPLPPFPVRCTIYSNNGLPQPAYNSEQMLADTLWPNGGVVVAFDSWTPNFYGNGLVRVRTVCAGDTHTVDDTASKSIFVYRPHYTGRDDEQYMWIDSDTAPGPTYAWIDTNGCYNVIVNDVDIVSPAYNGIGFNFVYRGATYNQIYLCNNGWMSFVNDTAEKKVNDSIPKPQIPNNALYPFWDSLRAAALPWGSRVCCKTIGYAPNREFVAIWNDLRLTSAPGDTHGLTFEVILEEGTNLILFQYKDVEGGLGNHAQGKTATVGIENAAGQVGLQYLYGDAGVRGAWPNNMLTPGRAIMFYQYRRDVGVTAIVQPPSYINPGLTQPQVRIKNYGVLAEPFYVYVRALPLSGQPAWTDSLLVTDLPIQRETLLTFGSWNAGFGTYTLKCSTALPFDTYSSNDVLTKTINVQAWLQKLDIPRNITNRRVKAGALAFNDHFIYALKGANTREFLRYDITRDSWDTLPPMPAGPRNKRTKDGCCLAAGPDTIYALKGGNTREFYGYDIASSTWTMLDSVPWAAAGASRAIRNGSSMVYTPGKVFLLRGNNTNDFLAYWQDSLKWKFQHSVESLMGPLHFKVNCKRGASITYDGDSTICLVVGSNTYTFMRYSMPRDSWMYHPSHNIPYGPNRRRAKAGSCSAIVNDTVFMLKGGNTTEFYAYDLNVDSFWRGRSPIPLGPLGKKVKTGAAMTASKELVYVLKGGNGQEFWCYGPPYDTGTFAARAPVSAIQNRSSSPAIAFACWAEPNPATEAPFINLALPNAADVRLSIYDITGQLLARLYEGKLAAGQHRFSWPQGHAISSGVYILKLESDSYCATRKLVIQRK